MVIMGPWRQYRAAYDRNGEGPREARIARGRRSASDDIRRDLGAQEWHLSAASPAPSSRPRARAPRPTVSLQWGEQVVKPIFESKDDYEIIYRLSAKLGFAEPMFKNIKVEDNHPSSEDLLREIKPGRVLDRLFRPVAGAPESAHEETRASSTLVTLRAKGRRAGRRRRLLWSAVAVLGHAGDQNIRERIRSTTPTFTPRMAAAPFRGALRRRVMRRSSRTAR